MSAAAEGSYIPIGNGRPTQKLKSFTRFEMTIGTAGFGFVVVAPCVAKDVASVWYTGAAFTGTDTACYFGAVPALRTGVSAINQVGGYTSADLQTPYNSGARAQQVYGRVVAASMSAQFTGLSIDQGGLVYCFTDPDHKSVMGLTVADLGARAETEIANTAREKCTITDFPLQEAETTLDRDLQYQASTGAGSLANKEIVPLFPFASGLYPNPILGGGVGGFAATFQSGQPTMCIVASGKAGNTLFIEVVQHLEYQGVATEGKTTPSPVDRVGFERVLGASSAALSNRSMFTNNMESFPSVFVNSLREANIALKPVSDTVAVRSLGA